MQTIQAFVEYNNKNSKQFTAYCKLIAIKNGHYTTYVFNNLDLAFNHPTKYIMCTRLPNWIGAQPKVGDEGYVTFQVVQGGKDSWYDTKTKAHNYYNYSAFYYLQFIPKLTETEQKRIYVYDSTKTK